MVKPKDRNKNRKFRRTPGGETRLCFESPRPGKHHCALCGKVMHGLPHNKTRVEVRKLSKTQRRPEAMFAGTLCNQCRTQVLDEAIKVKMDLKKEAAIALNLKPFVASALNHLE